jgi:hypothetical protein
MWYYVKDNERCGPIEEDKIQALINDGTIVPDTLVWREGMSDWQAANTSELAGLFSGIVPQVSSPPATTRTYNVTYEPRSLRTLWLWFAWLIGIGTPLSFVCIGFPAVIAAAVLQYILLYRFWTVIQDGNARTTPGVAVGFCFIPFFNFYWLYVAWVGLAKDMNAYCSARNIQTPEVSESLALWWYILSLVGVLSIIPYVGLFVGIPVSIANLVIVIIFTKQLVGSATAILNAKT